MELPVLYSLISVFCISLLSFAGAFTIGLKEAFLRKALFYFVAFAAGSLLGAAFLGILPEALEAAEMGLIMGYVLFGVLLFFFLERFIHWHHCRNRECEIKPLAFLNLIGDGIHNFIDGTVIAAAFLTSIPLGFLTVVAIALHEIPQEIGDFSLLILAGMKKARALLFNFLSGLTAVAGAVFTILFVSAVKGSVPFLLSIAGASFLYIALADIVPELHKEMKFSKMLLQFLFLLFGVLLIFSVFMLFPE